MISLSCIWIKSFEPAQNVFWSRESFSVSFSCCRVVVYSPWVSLNLLGSLAVSYGCCKISWISYSLVQLHLEYGRLYSVGWVIIGHIYFNVNSRFYPTYKPWTANYFSVKISVTLIYFLVHSHSYIITKWLNNPYIILNSFGQEKQPVIYFNWTK
jgi:hypothetical protein